MALPKKKTSKRRKNLRRTHYKVATAILKDCTSCGEKIRPHTTCQNCNTYVK